VSARRATIARRLLIRDWTSTQAVILELGL